MPSERQPMKRRAAAATRVTRRPSRDRAAPESDEGNRPVHSLDRAAIREINLIRPWPCDACALIIPVDELVRVHIVPGQTHNRVYHAGCDPTRPVDGTAAAS